MDNFIFSQSSQKGFLGKKENGGEKEKEEKSQLHIQIPEAVLKHLLAEPCPGILLFRVVCNYFATDVIKHTVTMWLFLSTRTHLTAYRRFCRSNRQCRVCLYI